ncbi:MAG: hypothetical protein AAF939_14270 [Planctomycetota bacterium]
MSQTLSYASSAIMQVAIRRRVASFIVTSLTTFLLMSFVWPLSVESYRSVVSIEIAKNEFVDSKENVKPMFSFAIREETNDVRLESALRDAEEKAELIGSTLSEMQHDEICQAIQIGVNDNGENIKLRIALDGDGGKNERALINVLANRIAFRMSTGRQVDNSSPVASLASQIPGAEGSTSSAEFDQIRWVVNQIRSDLANVENSIDGILNDNSAIRRNQGANSGRFQLASSASLNNDDGANLQSLADLKETVGSIDLQGLEDILEKLKTDGIEPSKPILEVISIDESQTYPVGGIPDFGSCLMMIAVSGLIGSLVAWHFDPFEHRGFADSQAIPKQLNIPVIAILESNSAPQEVSEHRWANATTKICSLFLLGATIVVGGFLLVDPEICEAFFVNPFYGFARIVGIFCSP